ncbi:MAG: EAL domain-containing protein, partial [Methylococcales bacterium]
LEETGLPAEQLELEITEQSLMENHDAEIVLDILNNLHALGIRLAIDNFGTGFSSLAYLKRFPLDRLKIDKSFISTISPHQDNLGIASTIIAIGHSLGFEVLAEGVETQEQLAFLREKGCDFYQGYIKSRPISAAEFTLLLREQNKTTK